MILRELRILLLTELNLKKDKEEWNDNWLLLDEISLVKNLFVLNFEWTMMSEINITM